MPTFFIDTDDGDTFLRDDEGLPFSDARAARWEALAAIPDMVKARMPDGDSREFTISVRDSDGEVIYQATLTLRGGWTAKGNAR